MMIQYKAALENPCESGCDFGVVIVEAPGCFSAGKTKEKAMENAKESLVGFLQLCLEEEGKIPEPDTGASWDDFKGPEWEKFTISVDSNTIKKANKVRRMLEGIRKKALRMNWTVFDKS